MIPYCLEAERILFGAQMEDFTWIFPSSPNISNSVQHTSANEVTSHTNLETEIQIQERPLAFSHRADKANSCVRQSLLFHWRCPGNFWVHFKVLHIFSQNTFPQNIVTYLEWAREEGHERTLLFPRNYRLVNKNC